MTLVAEQVWPSHHKCSYPAPATPTHSKFLAFISWQLSQQFASCRWFGYDHNNHESSATDLRIALFIAVFVLAWSRIAMFHKHHFFNILCIFFVLSIYFLNYFDKNYIKFLLIAFGVSIVLDLVWLIIHTKVLSNCLCRNTGILQSKHSTPHSIPVSSCLSSF